MLALLQVFWEKKKKTHTKWNKAKVALCVYFSGFYYEQILKLQLLKKQKKKRKLSRLFEIKVHKPDVLQVQLPIKTPTAPRH